MTAKLRVYHHWTWAFPRGNAHFGRHTFGYTWSCSCGAKSRGAHQSRSWRQALRDAGAHYRRVHQ